MPRLLLRTRWPFIIFAVAVLLAAQIMVTLNYFYQNSVQDLEQDISSAEKTLILQHEFMQTLQNAFLAQRSFSITGYERYRVRYENLLPVLDQKLDGILKTSRYSDKVAAKAIRAELVDMIKFMDAGIKRRDIEGDRLKPSPTRAQEAYLHMSHMERIVTRYIKQERTYLLRLKNEQQIKQAAYNQSILLAAILSSICLGALGYLLLKQQQKENLTQADLKSTKERLDLAITGANDGIWDWDLINNRIFLSARLKEIVGYRDEEMPNDHKAFDLLLHPDDRAFVWQANDDYLKNNASHYDCVFRMKHKDGTWRWIMSRGQALWDEDGKPYRMVGVHTDVTSMKTLEENLNKAREMAEDANRAKTDFLSNISHEIRTPLNAIIGISRILSKTKPLTEAFREHVNVLHTGANNLYLLINDLLDLSKLEQGSLELEIRDFRLRELIQENVELYRYYARDKSINLTFESNLTLDASYKGDSLRIGQIINNLLSNALKFTEAGTVHVSLNKMENGRRSRHVIQLIVEDTGIGIPADQYDNIFNKFTQSDQSISRRYGGTGLGLSICKELCNLMGATIEVHSLEGQGSEFKVNFTLEPLSTTASQNNVHHISSTGRQEDRILLVEDYAPNIFVIEALLNSIGYICDSITTGDEALRCLLSERRSQYAAVLMDLELPDMTGYEVAEKTRLYESKYALPSIPIIATTAHASAQHRDRCFASGMNDYLMKPVDLSALEKTLALYVPGRQSSNSQNPKITHEGSDTGLPLLSAL